MQPVPIQQNIDSPRPPYGLILTENSLQVEGDLNSQQISEVIRYFQTREQAMAWQLGDFLAWVAGHCGRQTAIRLADKMITPRRVYDFIAVAIAFPPDKRIIGPGVTFSHHEFALRETNEQGLALSWVARAGENQWSKNQMVEAIRTELEDSENEGTPAEPPFSPKVKSIYQLAFRIGKLRVEEFSPYDRKKLVEALSPAIKLYRQLTEGEEA